MSTALGEKMMDHYECYYGGNITMLYQLHWVFSLEWQAKR